MIILHQAADNLEDWGLLVASANKLTEKYTAVRFQEDKKNCLSGVNLQHLDSVVEYTDLLWHTGSMRHAVTQS